MDGIEPGHLVNVKTQGARLKRHVCDRLAEIVSGMGVRTAIRLYGAFERQPEKGSVTRPQRIRFLQAFAKHLEIRCPSLRVDEGPWLQIVRRW